MITYFVGFLTGLSTFFRSRYNLGLEIPALRQQLGVLKRKHPRPARKFRIEDFGFCSAGSRLQGASSWSSSIQKPLSPPSSWFSVVLAHAIAPK
jgi:hypothetical protein